MSYNWQHPDWPNFVYELEELQTVLYRYAMTVGSLSEGLRRV